MTTSPSDPLAGLDADDLLDMDDDELEALAGELDVTVDDLLTLFDFDWGPPIERVDPGPWL